MIDLFQTSFQAISEHSHKTFFLEHVFVEVRISGLQTFNIREKGAAMQRVLFEHLFLCDHFQKSICSTVFIKQSSATYVFQDVFQSFVTAVSKHPHQNIYDGVWLVF